MTKPTIEEIKEKLSSYEGHYNKLHTQQKEIDDYYELVFKAGVPERYDQRTPSTARDWVDVGVMHFTLDNPKSKVYLRNDSDTARRQVEKLETLYNFWLRKDIAAIKEAAKKELLRGEAFLRVNWDDRHYGKAHNDPDRLFYFPLFLTVPDPINVFASPAQEGMVPEDVIEKFNITVAEARAMCRRNGWEWDSAQPDAAMVAWTSYYSREWRCFLLEEKPVLPGGVHENLLGMCPYIRVPSGFGQSNYEGKPEYKYRSILHGKKDMLKMEARNLSQIDAINARYAWIRHKIKGDPELIKRLYPGGLPTDPDEILVEVPDQLEILTLQGETPPQGLYQQQAMLQSYAHPPQVLGGVRPTGVYSGQHQETLMATAKPIYKDAFKNLEDGLGLAMGMGARILERVYGSPLEIKNFASESSKMYMRVAPADIAGHYDCEVSLLAEPPEATDIRKGLGKALRQGGSISHMTELRQYQDMSQKEAEDEMAQIAAEIALQEPAVREVIAKSAMARLGMDQSLEALEEAEGQVVAGRPPLRTSPESTGRGIAPTRGRISPDLESMPTPHEQAAGR